jgi:hypothetical protein
MSVDRVGPGERGGISAAPGGIIQRRTVAFVAAAAVVVLGLAGVLSGAGDRAAAVPLTSPGPTTPGPSGPGDSPGSSPGPTATVTPPGSGQGPGHSIFTLPLATGPSGATGYPRTVPVSVGPTADGNQALTVAPRAYGQGVEYTAPASLLPYGGYLVSARVRLLRGPAQDMRITVFGGMNEHQAVRRVTADGWSLLETGFGRHAEDARPLVVRIEPLRLCGDAPVVPAAFQVQGSTVLAFNGDSWVRRQSTPACPMTSGPSPSPTPDPFAPGCTARYAVVFSRPGAFLATLRITVAPGRSALGWSAEWELPPGQVLTSVRPGADLLIHQGGGPDPKYPVVQHPLDRPDVMGGSSLVLQLIGTDAGTGTVSSVGLGDLSCTVQT